MSDLDPPLCRHPDAQTAPALAPPALDEVLGLVRHLPPMSATAQALLRLGHQADVAVPALTAVIRRDPALTLRVLKAANSAFYGLSGTIETLEDAVVVLGATTLRTLVLMGVVAHALPCGGACGMRKEAYWQEALVGAALAEVLARQQPVSAELAYTTALLHSVGELALCSVAPAWLARVQTAAAEGHCSLAVAWRTVLGWDLHQLGAALLREWGLPAHLASLVAQLGVAACHDLRHAEAGLLAVLRLALGLAAVQLPVDSGTAPDSLQLQAWSDLACETGSAAEQARRALGLDGAAWLALLGQAWTAVDRLRRVAG